MWSKKSVTKVTKGHAPDLLIKAEEELAAELDESERQSKDYGIIFAKRKSEGKNYRPAKPGDKDRPSKRSLEKGTKEKI